MRAPSGAPAPLLTVLRAKVRLSGGGVRHVKLQGFMGVVLLRDSWDSLPCTVYNQKSDHEVL